jgi:Ca2+-binding RTX toxin-like protein
MNAQTIEHLESRRLFAITASFSPGSGGILAITGDDNANVIIVSRNVAGQLFVNGGAVAISGGSATIANTGTIKVFARAGNDTVTLDETNGALPKAHLFGDAGNDILTGGSGKDSLFGAAGGDQLFGKGANDTMFGSADGDRLVGGTGDDEAFGESGNDRMVWEPGDGSDLNEGGDGDDAVRVNGAAAGETFTAAPNGSRVRFDRTNPAPFFIDIGTSETLELKGNGGNDSFTGAVGLAPLIKLIVDGGFDNDTINGGDGDDHLSGAFGDDLLDGNRGADNAALGEGNDTFQWDPGDGSDVIEGQGGADTLLFNGAAGGENIDITANGGRARFFRDAAAITMDMDDVERIDFNALGGNDNITVNSLAGTDVTTVNLNLSGVLDGNAGDGMEDTVTVRATNAADNVTVAGTASGLAVTGLAATVNVNTPEALLDRLDVQLLAGNDTFSATGLAAGVIALHADGAAGNDTITGSANADLLIGANGDDSLLGGDGDDALLGGLGTDTLDGQGGNDTEVQ